MRDARIKIDDALGAASSYLHAIRLMAEVVFKGEGKDYCAFDLLVDSTLIEIENAHSAFDEHSATQRPSDAVYIASLIEGRPSSDDMKILDDIDALRKRTATLIENIQRVKE
jgi:hypothetical protein